MWNKSAGVGRWLCTLGASLALAASLPGCMAHARGEVVYGEPVTVVERAPARIESYPRYVYRGRPAYLVDGRWYYHDNRDRWVVFRDEPRELRDYRVRRAPDYDRRPSRYSGDRRSHYQDRRAAELSERRRIDDRRQVERRAEARREERREAERRAERRADRRDAKRAAEHRAAERRADERRAAEHRSKVRRIEERRDRERRATGERRTADEKSRDVRKRERSRRDADDSPRERRHRND